MTTDLIKQKYNKYLEDRELCRQILKNSKLTSQEKNIKIYEIINSD